MTGYRDDRDGLRQALDESRQEAERLRKRVSELESTTEDEPAPPSAPPSVKSTGGRVWLAGFGTLALFLLGPGIGIWVCVSIRPTTQGSVESTGGELGKWTLPIHKCLSGDRQNFFGVDLSSHSNTKLGVRVLVDPSQGKLLNVTIASSDNRAVQFNRESCPKFEIDVRKSNTQVNDVRLFEGSIDFDCTQGPNGKERVFGKVKFENCQ